MSGGDDRSNLIDLFSRNLTALGLDTVDSMSVVDLKHRPPQTVIHLVATNGKAAIFFIQGYSRGGLVRVVRVGASIQVSPQCVRFIEEQGPGNRLGLTAIFTHGNTDWPVWLQHIYDAPRTATNNVQVVAQSLGVIGRFLDAYGQDIAPTFQVSPQLETISSDVGGMAASDSKAYRSLVKAGNTPKALNAFILSALGKLPPELLAKARPAS